MMFFYPLSKKRIEQLTVDLAKRRSEAIWMKEPVNHCYLRKEIPRYLVIFFPFIVNFELKLCSSIRS
jgi:hypothetical protein